jgi:hypothetical protein
MSLDLTLYIEENGEEEIIADMNWLRNPFGLVNFVQSNLDEKREPNLYYVCNEWSYSKGNQVDRKLFKEVVDWYAERFLKLDKMYATFDSFRSLKAQIPEIAFGEDLTYPAKIPIEKFEGYRGFRDNQIEFYKNWMRELQDFANKLQDERTIFYCSN